MANSHRSKLPFLLLVLARLILTGPLPMTAMAENGYDEALFIRLAATLAGGHWLGLYDPLTLVKGPGYPIFIAAAYHFGLPLALAQHLLYVLFCIVLMIAIAPAIGSQTARVFVFAVLLFSPLSLHVDLFANSKREAIYPAVCGLVIACSLAMSLRHESSLTNLCRWGTALGLALGFFWITREEGIWIVPSVALLLVYGIVAVTRARRTDWVKRVMVYLLPVALCVGGVCLVAGINRIEYGEFVTVELKEPAFLAAYGALARVKPAVFQDHIPVARETRQRIYQVSPAFGELRPFLDGPRGEQWATISAEIYPEHRGEIAGGWFVWALREAVGAAGHAHSGKDAHVFYNQLAHEVNAACDDGRLTSDGPRRDSMTPRWQWRYLSPTWTAAKAGAWMLPTLLDGFTVYIAPSNGAPKDIRAFATLTGRPVKPAGNQPATAFLDAGYHFRLRIIRGIVTVYQAIGLPWTIGALIFFLMQGAMFLAGYRSGFLLAGASLLLAIVTRLALLAYIDATSFQAITTVYLSPCYPFMLLFDSLMTVAAAIKLRGLLAGRAGVGAGSPVGKAAEGQSRPLTGNAI